jgi:3-oxoacyl-[acyl-carrier protein] reductase
MNPNNALSRKMVFIQGAGRQPGPHVVRAFAGQGASVAACDLSPILLKPFENSETGLEPVRTYVGDTSRGMPARALVDEVLSDCGRIDILINNLRVAPATSLLQMDEWDWQRTIDLNLNGVFLLTRLVAQAMVEQGGGVMINLMASPGPALATPGRAAYAASQMGLLALTQAAAQELIAYNIRVYGVCVEGLEANSDKLVESAPSLWIGERTPVPESYRLSELLVFLSTPAAEAIPGQVFRTVKDRPGIGENPEGTLE